MRWLAALGTAALAQQNATTDGGAPSTPKPANATSAVTKPPQTEADTLLGAAETALNPSKTPYCTKQCNAYRAGADANTKIVCQYERSGVGAVSENKGVTCYPNLNCGADWSMCYQANSSLPAPSAPTSTTPPQGQNSTSQDSTSTLPPAPSLPSWEQLTPIDEDDACAEIAGLEAGGNDGFKPPAGGWKPTSTGWVKGTGDVWCGWGSTYQVFPWQTVADYGRVVYTDVANEVECCKRAAKYALTKKKDGGRAIRFQWRQSQNEFGIMGSNAWDAHGNGDCTIDREDMMRANLDSSSGKALSYTQTCGEGHYYWRNAAGGADGSNLKSGGKCVAQHGFRRVMMPRTGSWNGQELPTDATLPWGQIGEPNFHELPNHKCDGDTFKCGYVYRLNHVADPGECCEACASLSNLKEPYAGAADVDVEGNPCVAWQIVAGRCRIARKKFIDETWLQADTSLSYEQFFEECPGSGQRCGQVAPGKDSGFWGGCKQSRPGYAGEPITNADEDCNYYSFMYWRDPALITTTTTTTTTTAAPTGSVAPGSTAQPRRAAFLEEDDDDYDLDESTMKANGLQEGGAKARRLSAAVSAYRKLEVIPLSRVPGALVISANVTILDDRWRVAALYAGKQGAGVEQGAVKPSCAQIEVFPSAAIDPFLSTADVTVYNEEAGADALCASELLCADGPVTVTCTLETLTARRAAGDASVLVSFNSVGAGLDTVDFEVEPLLLGEAPATTTASADPSDDGEAPSNTTTASADANDDDDDDDATPTPDDDEGSGGADTATAASVSGVLLSWFARRGL